MHVPHCITTNIQQVALKVVQIQKFLCGGPDQRHVEDGNVDDCTVFLSAVWRSWRRTSSPRQYRCSLILPHCLIVLYLGITNVCIVSAVPCPRPMEQCRCDINSSTLNCSSRGLTEIPANLTEVVMEFQFETM